MQYHYSTPLKKKSSNCSPHSSVHSSSSSTPVQRPTPLSASRSSSATSSTASSPSCSPSPPMKRHRMTPRRHLSYNNHNNLAQECLRLLTRSNKLLLGMACLLITWLLTAPPYQRMALERVSNNYDLPEDVSFHSNLRHQTKRLHFQLGAPDVELEPVRVAPKPLVQLTPQAFLPLAPVQVHFLADATVADTTSKFILDGLERSQYMELTAISIAQLHATERQLATLEVFERNSKKPLLYVVDWGSMNRDCGLLHTLLQETEIQYTSCLLLVDFSASHRLVQCPFLEDYKHVKHTKRSVVEKRFWDTTFQWVSPGKLVEEESIHYAPLVLRESFVDLMHNVSLTTTTQDRRMDLLFNHKPGDNSHYGFLRRLVADKVLALGGNVTSFAGSDRGYVEALLKSKICVVAQRDEWEGHYRLLEAMASGVMVLTDPMLAMPMGFQNGTNLVVYRNWKELKQYIRYYLSSKGTNERLEIAQQGRDLVLGRHRSWHRMEEIVFGQAVTSVDQPDAEAPLKRERPELKLVEHS